MCNKDDAIVYQIYNDPNAVKLYLTKEIKVEGNNFNSTLPKNKLINTIRSIYIYIYKIVVKLKLCFPNNFYSKNKDDAYIFKGIIEKLKRRYAIRIQYKILQNRLTELKQIYPDYQILLQLDNDPNTVKLYNLMKEELGIEFEGNYFNSNISKNRLITTISYIYTDI